MITREDKNLSHRTTERKDLVGVLADIENTGLTHVPREHLCGLVQFQTCDRLLLFVDLSEEFFTNARLMGLLPRGPRTRRS